MDDSDELLTCFFEQVKRCWSGNTVYEDIELSMWGDASPLEYLFLMCTVHLGEFFLGPTRELGNWIVNLAMERHIQRDCYVTQGKFEQRAGDNIYIIEDRVTYWLSWRKAFRSPRQWWLSGSPWRRRRHRSSAWSGTTSNWPSRCGARPRGRRRSSPQWRGWQGRSWLKCMITKLSTELHINFS